MALHRDIDQSGVLRSFSYKLPAHFKLKIESFSLLIENSVDRIESGDFEAGGCKWRLVVCPNGNKIKNVRDHISLYLKVDRDLSSADQYESFGEKFVDFRLFLLDRKKGMYLVLEDAKRKTPFSRMVSGTAGFDRVIPLKEFTDASNGYLIDDTCVFGAEIFVCEERTDTGHCCSMIKNVVMRKHVWKIENFSRFHPLSWKPLVSEPFISGDEKCIWKICLGYKENGSYISIYLQWANPTSLPPGSKVLADSTVRILNQINAKHKSHTEGGCEFSSSSVPMYIGFHQFIKADELLGEAGMGLLLNDTCIVEAEITVRGIINASSI